MGKKIVFSKSWNGNVIVLYMKFPFKMEISCCTTGITRFYWVGTPRV